MLGTAHKRRRMYLVFLVLWIGPGTAATYLLAHSTVWVNVQSWLAMTFALAGAFSAETPVEPED